VPLLAQAFLKEFAEENNKPVNAFSPEALQALVTYPWPGNVRELRTAIEHAVVYSRGNEIALRDLPPQIQGVKSPSGRPAADLTAQQNMTVKEAEKQLIVRALKEAKGNRTLAAHKIGMSRRTLHRKLHTYHLEGF